MFSSPQKMIKGYEKYFTPIRRIKNQMPNTQDKIKKIPIPQHLEERLKDNIGVIEFLDDNKFKRYRSRQRLKTIQDYKDTKSVKKKIFHSIQEKLKWKDKSIKNKSQINRDISLDSKIQNLQNILGKIKQLNTNNIKNLTKIKGQQVNFNTPQKDQKSNLKVDNKQRILTKSQLIIQKYQKNKFFNTYNKLQYSRFSGSALKGQYRYPQYIKPIWIKSQTQKKKTYENLQDIEDQKKKYNNRSAVNLFQTKERKELYKNLKYSNFEAEPLIYIKNV